MPLYCLQHLSVTFPIQRRIEHCVINVLRSVRMLIAPEFSRWIFETSNTKVHENPSSGNPVVPCRRRDIQTDGQTDGQIDITN